LLLIAKKFAVRDLIKLCERELPDCLDLDNAMETRKSTKETQKKEQQQYFRSYKLFLQA
jgi:hypothetical protein